MTAARHTDDGVVDSTDDDGTDDDGTIAGSSTPNPNPNLVPGPRSVYGFLEVLGRAARRDALELAEVDSEPIVDAAARIAAARIAAACSAAGQDAEDVGAVDLGALARECGAAVAAVQARTCAVWPSFPPVGAVSWTGFGAVIPVLAGSPGAGASCVAAALADVAMSQRCTLLVDADDPDRSGLVCATSEDGPWTRTTAITADGQVRVRVRYSWRGDPGRGVLLARAETSLPVFTPGMCPAPPDWLPDPAPDPLHLTVVDLGYGGWRAAASPLYGPGAWLRAGHPVQRPVLVVRASRPSLRQAEHVLARLADWVDAGAATAVFQLVVCGARKWPPGIAGTAGPRIRALLDTAVFIPHDPGLAADGVTADPSPARVSAALRPLLTSWGVLK